MSYQVFARKYRPQTFDDVVGQDHIVQTLRNAIQTNRLAHAYLFVGPRGTGKTSTARIMAKALNCVHGPTITPCGTCDVCREIAAGNSLDVLEIDGASNNGVEQVRELRENVRFAPTRGQFKIYIIDEVHMLTPAAFNALLKTLEEPPAHVKFIFATTDVQKVLPTILSRCQRFDLRRIPTELIAEHLGFIARNEGITLDPEAARTIARGADGGMRDAESMLDQLVAFCGERITEADALAVFGFTAAQTVFALCDGLIYQESPTALAILQEQAEAGRDLSRLMGDLIGHLRNLLVAKADPEGIKAEIGEEAYTLLNAQAGKIGIDRLLELIEQFAAAESRMKWAPNKKLHFEIAIIKAIQTLGQATLGEVIDTLSAIRSGGELPAIPSKPVRTEPAPPRTPPAPVAAPKAPTPPPTPPAPPVAQKPPTPPPAPAPAPVEEKAPEPTVAAPIVAAPVAATPVPPAPVEAPPPKEETPPWEEPEEEPEAPPFIPPGEEPDETSEAPDLLAPVETPAPAAPASDDLSHLWVRVLCEIRSQRMIVLPSARAAVLLGLENGVATLAFPKDDDFNFANLSKKSNADFVEAAFTKIVGSPVTVRFERRAGLEIPGIDLPEQVEEVEDDPMEAFKNDPLIRKALEIFQAELQKN